MTRPNKKKRKGKDSTDLSYESIEESMMMSPRNDEFNNKINQIHRNTEKLIEEFQELRMQMKTLQAENECLKSDNTKLKQRVIDLEQYGRRLNLRFLGIKEEVNEKDENCEKKLMDIIKNKLQINKEIIIDVAHRVGKRTNERPRPIIARFGLRKYASEILANRRKLKGEKGLSIVEDLCPENASIYTKARLSGCFVSVWTHHGKVNALTKTGEKIRINNENDVNKYEDSNINNTSNNFNYTHQRYSQSIEASNQPVTSTNKSKTRSTSQPFSKQANFKQTIIPQSEDPNETSPQLFSSTQNSKMRTQSTPRLANSQQSIRKYAVVANCNTNTDLSDHDTSQTQQTQQT